jgi:hypothetical protein
MKYETARELIAEALEQLDEATGTNMRRRIARGDRRLASLMGRAGASSDEIKATIGGKRTPAAKSGRAKLAGAERSARQKQSEKMPNYPYGRKGPR